MRESRLGRMSHLLIFEATAMLRSAHRRVWSFPTPGERIPPLPLEVGETIAISCFCSKSAFHRLASTLGFVLIRSLFLSCTLNLLTNFHRQLRQSLQSNIFSWVQWAEYFFHRLHHRVHDILVASVKQPPAERQVFPVRLKVISVCMLDVVVISVFQVYLRPLPLW
jgi:hypothetical protein